MANGIFVSSSKKNFFFTLIMTLFVASSFFVAIPQAFAAIKSINSVAAGSQTGSLTYGTAASATFAISSTLTGNGSNPIITYSVTAGLPLGATALFSSNPNSSHPTYPSTLTISTSASTPAGTYSVTVKGDDGTLSKTTTATLTVNTRSITVAANVKSKTYGEVDPALTYTVTSGTLVGNDSFTGALTRDAGENVGTYAITQGTLTAGSNYALTYAGANLTINKADTTTTITNAASLGSTPTVVGQPYTVTWSVTSSAGTPTGTVTVSGGSGCSASVAIGKCDLTSTTPGAKNITASYGGDGNFNASDSSSAPHTVNKANTSIQITNSGELAAPSYAGYAYTVKWTVSVTDPGAGTPTGDVMISGGSGCTAAVADGQCDVTSTEVGAKSLVASYAGDGNFNGSETAGGMSHSVLDPTATIHIIKHVLNHDIAGFNKSAGDFTIDVTGVSPSNTGFAGSEEGTTVTLQPGAYSVDEESNLGYAESLSEDCSGTISPAVEVTCTITNSDFPLNQAALTVIKKVTNDNGGTAKPNDFTLTVSGEEGDDEVDSGATAILDPDTYTVGENSKDGYTQVSIAGDCAPDGSITLEAGHAYTCTITNDDSPGTLHIIKNLINNNGGTAVASDFRFSLNGGDPAAFEEDGQNDLTVSAGTYSVAETATSTYATTYDNCSDIRIANGGEATCTITNDDQPATLIIIKHSVGADDTFQFHVSGTDFNPALETSGGVATSSDIMLDAGTYDVTEDAKSGWSLTGVSCKYGNESVGASSAGGEQITVDSGDSVICTFTNEKGIFLMGTKWNDSNGNGIFDQGELGIANWTISAIPITGEGTTTVDVARSATSTVTGEEGGYKFKFSPVNFGWWRVSEASQDGWRQTYPADSFFDVFVDGSADAETLSNKNFGNFHQVTIIGFKFNDVNGDGQKNTNEPGLKNWEVSVRRAIHEPVQHILIDTEMVQLALTGADGGFTLHAPTPGHYIVTETAQSGWRQTTPGGNSFFDVFVDISGQTINAGKVNDGSPLTIIDTREPVPFEFGNQVIPGSSLSVTTASNNDGTKSGRLVNTLTATTSTPGGSMSITIPENLTVTGPSGWGGTINLPTATTTTVVPTADPGETATAVSSIEIGFSDTLLTFNKGVRILFTGQAGRFVGYSRGGVFTAITSVCGGDSQAVGDALPAGADCKIDVGSDLVVWTKHFTTFIVYTQTAAPAPSGGGGAVAVGNGALGIVIPAVTPRLQTIYPDGHIVYLNEQPTAPPQGQVLGAAAYNFAQNLRYDNKGIDVTELQKILIAAGFLKIPTPTGWFGRLTLAAVKKYQSAHGIPTTGFVGPMTRGVLNQGT